MVAKVIPEERKCLVCPAIFMVGGTGNKKRSQVYCSTVCRAAAKVNGNSSCASTLTRVQQAYLAGMVDADGHIGLYVKTRPKSTSTSLRVEITNTDRAVLDWTRKVTGVGRVYEQRHGDARRKPTYYWMASGEPAASLLRQIEPFMIVKKARALLAIDFRERLQDPIQKVDKTWQSDYRNKMLAMNKRGPKE